jgi:hypothetical protein
VQNQGDNPNFCTLSAMPRKQPTHLTPKDVASHAYQWSRTELVEMKAIIDALLEACDPEPEAKQEPVEGKQQGVSEAGGISRIR